jgi:hypothetical protein
MWPFPSGNSLDILSSFLALGLPSCPRHSCTGSTILRQLVHQGIDTKGENPMRSGVPKPYHPSSSSSSASLECGAATPGLHAPGTEIRRKPRLSNRATRGAQPAADAPPLLFEDSVVSSLSLFRKSREQMPSEALEPTDRTTGSTIDR